MRIVSKNTGYLSNIERFYLDDLLPKSASNTGLIICYAIAITSEQENTLQAKGDHGDG